MKSCPECPPGKSCRACYDANRRRWPRGVPCTRCLTAGGYRKPGSDHPERLDGRKYGINGPICKACQVTLYRWLTRGVPTYVPKTCAAPKDKARLFLERHKVNPAFDLEILNGWQRAFPPKPIRKAIDDYDRATMWWLKKASA